MMETARQKGQLACTHTSLSLAYCCPSDRLPDTHASKRDSPCFLHVDDRLLQTSTNDCEAAAEVASIDRQMDTKSTTATCKRRDCELCRVANGSY